MGALPVPVLPVQMGWFEVTTRSGWLLRVTSARRTAERPLENLPAELVEQRQAALAFTANALVLRTADRMMKALLDIRV